MVYVYDWGDIFIIIPKILASGVAGKILTTWDVGAVDLCPQTPAPSENSFAGAGHREPAGRPSACM